MARRKWTLALIIICLPILATVITAFRVRDLPKGFEESLRPELKKKCVDCEVNDPKDKHSVKIESDTKRFEEPKKSVREKLPEQHQKPDKGFKFIDDSADDDDGDDDLEFLKSETVFKREEHSKVAKAKKDSKKETAGTSSISLDDDDDDEDDDDDDTNNYVISGKKNELGDKKNKKVQSIKSQTAKDPKVKKATKKINDDDDDDNDDDDDDEKKNKPSKKKIDSGYIQQPKDSKPKTVKKLKLLDDDDILLKKPKVGDGIKKIESDKNKPMKDTKDAKVATIKHVGKYKKGDDDDQDDEDDNDDDDDDDGDDDDDNDNDKGKGLKTEKKKKEEHTVKKPQKTSKTETSSKKTGIKKDDDDDADDDDDDDDEDCDKGDPYRSLKNVAKDKNVVHVPKLDKPEKLSSKPDQKDIKKDKPTLKYEKKDKVDSKPKKQEEKSEGKKIDKVKKESKPIDREEDKKTVEKQKLIRTEEKKDDIVKKLKEPEKEKTNPEQLKNKADSKENIDKLKTEVKKTAKKEFKRDSSTEMYLDSREYFGKSDQMKHVSDALHRRNLLHSEFEDFYAFLPTFAPNFSRIHNPECRRHGQILLRQLRGTKLWALNMLDATAKIPSGILQGNGIQLGDFDQCLNSRAKVQLDTGSVVKVQGQYCLARVDVKAQHEELETPVHLAQAKNLIKSKIDDPGHFVPRFSTLSWGVCLPSACNPEDAEVVIKDAVKHYQHRSGFAVKVKVDEDDCHIQDADWWEDWLELPTILTLSLYGVIILLVLIATIQDFLARRKAGQEPQASEDEQGEEKEQKEEEKEPESKQSDGFLSSFSLYYTISKLTASSTSDEIACIHGVRGIATIALLIAHKILPVAVMPYTNRLKITEIVSSPIWSWARAGWMYTDCFLLLSGALTAHRISDSDSGALWRLFTRYLRLTPALLAVVLFYAYVWDLVSVGPMWGTLVTKNAEVCQEGWWWNLLYVQNYFGFEDMCAPQTHQLALDMQMTILGGIIVWALQSTKIVSRVLMPVLHVLAAYLRYSTVLEHRLTLLAYHGVTVSQLYRTARLSYTSVLHRSTPYLIGLSLGLYLRKPSQHGKIFLTLGWLISIVLWSSVWWAGFDSGATTYRYSATFAAQYAALAPIASALAVAWLIYAVHTSHSSEGLVSRFLCSRPLALISRLSYALYLCQFVVFLTNAGIVRTATEFSLMSLFDVQELSGILLSSTILTLTFVIPMQNLHKIFTFPPKTETEEENKEDDKETQEKVEEPEDKETEQVQEEEIIEVPQVRSRPSFLAHREVLEEIPEIEVEYEIQRDKNDGLEEILEEEEDEGEEMANHIDEDELEIIEEEGGEDFWEDREEEYTPRRSYVREDGEEWEWTANGSGRGAQYYRYAR